MASQATIRRWLDNAKSKGATHMLVVSDTFNHECYPVNVMPCDNASNLHNKYNAMEMQKVMEVYSLSKNIELQLNEHRALHLD